MEQVKAILNKIKEFWNNLTRKNKIIILAGAVAILIVSIFTVVIATSTEYVSAFDGLETSEASEIIKILQELGVDFKYNNNQILIEEKQLDAAVMQLAAQGYPKSGSNYDLFINNSDIMNTDFEKQQYLIFQMQERLANQIKTLDGVSKATVNITIPDNKEFVFASEKVDPTAAVALTLRNDLTKNQVSGIKRLVMNSVSGLKEENITIIDSEGNELLTGDAFYSDEKTRIKLELEKQIDTNIKNKVLELLVPRFGVGKVAVSVSATLNYDKMSQQITEYTPSDEGDNRGVISEEQVLTETSTTNPNQGGIPGTETNSENPNDETVTYPEVEGSNGDQYTHKEEYYTYKVDEKIVQVEKDSVEIESVSIGVIVDQAEMTDDERDSLKYLVEAAAGQQRTVVSLYNMPFAPVEEGQTLLEMLLSGTNLIIVSAILGILIITIVTMSIVAYSSSRKRKALLESIAADDAAKAAAMEMFGAQQEEPMPIIESISLNNSKEAQLKKQIKEFATSNPEIVAQLLRTWLKGDADYYG